MKKSIILVLYICLLLTSCSNTPAKIHVSPSSTVQNTKVSLSNTISELPETIQPEITPKTELPKLPISASNNVFKPLSDINDPKLNEGLLEIINKNKGWSNQVKQKSLCIGIVDLSDVNQPKYAQVNDTVMMYSASLPKIAVMLTVMNEINRGTIKETSTISKHIDKMINESNNESATALINLVGFSKIRNILTDDQYKLYDSSKNGGLWVGKKYSRLYPEAHPDPINKLLHGANILQVCRFYYMMAYGKLIDYNSSKKMLGYMDSPAINNKFVSQFKIIDPAATLYRKYGDWLTYHSDSVLVWGENRRYIAVIIANDTYGELTLRNLIVEIDQLITSNDVDENINTAK